MGGGYAEDRWPSLVEFVSARLVGLWVMQASVSPSPCNEISTWRLDQKGWILSVESLEDRRR